MNFLREMSIPFDFFIKVGLNSSLCKVEFLEFIAFDFEGGLLQVEPHVVLSDMVEHIGKVDFM